MRSYLAEKGIPHRINGLPETSRSTEEILNGERGQEPWNERQYSSDPDYNAVDPVVFDYLEAIQK